MIIQKTQPVYRQIYEYLFKQITEGTLPSGSRLAEEPIAAQLGVSRTPVREAILQLEHEGLLRNKTVIEPTAKEIKDSYELRILLEGYAARKAAAHMNPDDRHLLQQLVGTSGSMEFAQRMKTNTAFHNLIVRACDNDQIAQSIEKIQAVILMCRKDITHDREELPNEHVAIAEAILAGDADNAEKMMKQHLKRNFDNFVKKLPMNELISGLSI
ncbi:GntR family transcriptional regulator [Alicyclobacillus tolerans]|uniref:GntR family transcriptional regulator n=1 Tax=Alicyclobacillus tolerans TaxID=90970 RepID=UPI001F2E9BDB|nr:GntR family transcriptional regulator [Alicyclobacillus tolerans]MCF8567825.1 GntR family transcriptional regulator [Alicyclobacillus tolerans]